MKKGKIKYLLLVSLLNVVFISNSQALTVNVEEKPGHQTNFGYKTQTQTISGTRNCNEGNSEIYCVDKGISNVKSFSTCTISSLNGTPFETIAFDENATHDEKEFAFRMLAKKLYPSLIKSSYKYDEKYVNNLNSNLQGVVRSSSAGAISKIISSAKGSWKYDIISKDANNVTVKITINLENKNLSSDKFYAKVGKIDYVDISRSANGVYVVTATAPMKKCKGANFDIRIKGGVISETDRTSQYNKKGVFHANCTDGQNYIIIVKNQCTIDEITQDSQEGISYKINVPDSNCSCPPEDGNGNPIDKNSEFNCKGDENNQELTINETSKVKQCITSGSGALDKCDSNILKLSNSYCKIYCKEDITLNFPGKVTAKSGTYFTLNKPFTKLDGPISVKGTRTCYAGQPDSPSSDSVDGIDQDKYIDEVKKMQTQAIEHYNEYLKIKAYMRAIEDAKKASNLEKSHCDQTCTTSRTCSAAEKAAGQTSCSDSNSTRDPATDEYEYRSGKDSYVEKEISWIGTKGQAKAVDGSKISVEVKWGKKAGAGSCSNGTATCASPDDFGEESDWTNKYNEKKANGELDKAKEAIEKLEEAVEEYNKCFSWTNNYCGFEPMLYFSYDEVYNDQIEGYLEIDGAKKINENGTDCYLSETDNLYEGSCGQKSENKQTYIKVNDGGITTMEKTLDMEHQYVKKSQESSKNFKSSTGQMVCTYHPDGTILIGNDCAKDNNHILLGKNGENGYVFPVALEHRKTAFLYNYSLKIENIGAEGDDTNCAIRDRIIGDSCSEYSVATGGKEGKYVCQYSIGDCPECDIECVCPDDDPYCYVKDKRCYHKDPCTPPENPPLCTNCTIECIGCLWNDDDTTIAYKTVSLNDLFPNEDTTKVGYNWNTSSKIYEGQKQDVIDNSAKAQETINSIEKNGSGETIYDNENKELQYSYELTPDTMSKIREYNKSANSDNTSNIPKGGYSNDTLHCSKVETTLDGAKYATECKSSFLDQSFMTKPGVQKQRNDVWKKYNTNGTAWK